MTIPNYFTWDGDPGNSVLPFRPSTDDLGGDNLRDDLVEPPVEGEMPTAGGWNQRAMQVAALAAMTPAAKVYVKITASVPAVQAVIAPGSGIIPGTFTPTDNGTGDTTLTWPAGTFPGSAMPPEGSLIGSGGSTPTLIAQPLTHAVRVRTQLAGAATDIDFVVTIWGD